MTCSLIKNIYLVVLIALWAAGGCRTPIINQQWIHSITLRGNNQLKKVPILEGLVSQKTGWWPFATKKIYEPVQLATDLKRIETYYASKGFFKAKVTKLEVLPRKKKQSVDIIITVEEGPGTRVDSLKVAGIDVLTPELQGKLRQQIKINPGDRFDHQKYTEAKEATSAFLDTVGYPYAKVWGEVKVDRKKSKANIELSITPGTFVRFGQTTLEGNGAIPEKKILNLVRWKTGQPFDQEKVQRTQTRLLQQRVFSTVRIERPETEAPVANMRIVTEVGKLHEVRLGGGVGFERRRQEVRLRSLWTQRNFLGGLRVLTLDLRPSYVVLPAAWSIEEHGLAIKSEASLRQPDIFSTDIALFGKLGYELGIHEGYRFHGPHVQAGADRPFFNDTFIIGLSWNLTFLDFFNYDRKTFDSSSTMLGLGFVDPYRLTWFEESFHLDLRDDPFEPHSGFFGALFFEEGFSAIGSDFTYLRFSPEVRGYVPLGTKRIVLAARALFGQLWARSPADSPLTHRFYLGGPNSHRGFTFGRLAPQLDTATQSRVPIGGNSQLLFSTDVRFRVFKLFGYWMLFVTFFDAGDVTAQLDQMNIGQLHLAVGGSINYETPIGAIRAGIGVRLNRLDANSLGGQKNPDPGDRIAFFITIGEAF